MPNSYNIPFIPSAAPVTGAQLTPVVDQVNNLLDLLVEIVITATINQAYEEGNSISSL